VEDTIRVFYLNWTGTGTVTGSGDNEKLVIQEGQQMTSEPVDTEGVVTIEVLLNVYGSGDSVPLYYKTGNSIVNMDANSWMLYSTPFASQGFVRLKLEP
jgi:hypothetical protein